MDAATLAEAMGCPRDRADTYLAAFNAAMLQANCRTVNRAAMWCAQLGHESTGLRHMQEIWGPTAAQRRYEGRADLGNTQPGDGSRFRGHGPIQITGRHNHALVSRWAHQHGSVPTPTYFVDRPDDLAGARYGFLGAVWYWTVARPQINELCDRGDLVGVTRAINGGTNGLDDRRRRWDACRRLGNRILPTATPEGDWFDMATEEDLRRILREEAPRAIWHHPIPDWYTQKDDAMPAFAALGWAATHPARALDEIRAARAEIATLRAALAQTTARPDSAPALTADQVAELIRDALADLGPLFLTARPTQS